MLRYLGAALIASSLLIMYALIVERAAMAALAPVEAWYVLSSLLSPIGYVIQDTVADAMTVEAVPTHDDHGAPLPPERKVSTRRSPGGITISESSSSISAMVSTLAKLVCRRLFESNGEMRTSR